MQKPKKKNGVRSEHNWDEIRKGWIKFCEFLGIDPALVDKYEVTLEEDIITKIMIEIINNRRVKNAYEIEDHIRGLSFNMGEITPQVDEDGELIDVKEEEDRFRITVKNRKGQIKMHFLPENAVKRK